MQQQSFGDTVEKMIVSDRIVDPLCVFVTSEYGWPAKVERITKAQALSDSSTAPCTMSEKTTKVNPTPSTMRVEGGSADKSNKTYQRTQILRTSRDRESCSHDPTGTSSETILVTDQDIHKWQEQIIKNSQNHTLRTLADPASREHSCGEDAQNPQDDDARREG